jgi:hypothetical protein
MAVVKAKRGRKLAPEFRGARGPCMKLKWITPLVAFSLLAFTGNCQDVKPFLGSWNGIVCGFVPYGIRVVVKQEDDNLAVLITQQYDANDDTTKDKETKLTDVKVTMPELGFSDEEVLHAQAGKVEYVFRPVLHKMMGGVGQLSSVEGGSDNPDGLQIFLEPAGATKLKDFFHKVYSDRFSVCSGDDDGQTFFDGLQRGASK